MIESYYDILGVPRDASLEQIKEAKRRKAKECHPDREGGSTEKMAQVNRAYEVLSDAKQRAAYDLAGEDGLFTEAQRDNEARQILIRLMRDALSRMVMHCESMPNFMPWLTQRLDEERNRVVDKLDHAKEAMKVLQREQKRLRRKDNAGASLYEEIVTEEITRCARAVVDGDKALSSAKRAIEMLKELEEVAADTSTDTRGSTIYRLLKDFQFPS